ncbi:DUF4240 domain-containing protein [Kitasatospora sp. NPDC049285]|uniref:DUF4240 domain-containing protein n=1 Tax=Kitasatospora sp. NPDC049285 TaxID=3157096 RepID=UPI0034333CD8
MDVNGFWELVEASREIRPEHEQLGCGRPECERAERLTERLATLPVEEVLEFQLRLDEVRAPLDTMATLAVAKLVQRGRISDDGLWYFHAWLIGLGRTAYATALADPDALADQPAVRRLAALPYQDWDNHDFPDWEELDYCAAYAHERITGEEDGLEDLLAEVGHDSPVNAEPVGEVWTPADTAARLPRLSALFAEAS